MSVGVVDGEVLLDLDYAEDSRASVDLTVVETAGGGLIEVQGAAETKPFSRKLLNELLEVAGGGISTLVERQRAVLSGIPLGE